MPFSASIIQRVFADVPDQILKLGGAAYLRQLPVTTMPWSRIRIGLLCAVTTNGTSNIADVLFTLGVCSGQQYPGANNNTINYIGASLIGLPAPASTRLLTYTASATGPYFACTAGAFFSKLEGSIIQTAAAFSPVLNISTAFTGRYDRRTVIVLDITKSQGDAGAVTMTLYAPSAAQIQAVDFRPDDLQAALDCLGTPIIRDQTLTVLSTNSTVLYNPALGDLDTFEVFWSSNAFPLEISALGATNLMTPAYPGTVGGAIETFEEYGTVSADPPGFISGGSGWAAAGSIGYGNTPNFAPQIYTQYVGTTYSPDEPFEQYTTGTVNSGVTVNAGSFWSAPAVIVAVSANVVAQVYPQLAGTNIGAADEFELYATNSPASPYVTTFTFGTNWGADGTIYSYGSAGRLVPSLPNLAPINTVFIAGTAFPSLAGTVYNAYDTFEDYAVGPVVSGVTINAGSFWAGAGSIY